MSTVEFFYDFTCPYAYLGSTQIEALCTRVGAELIWRPMLLGGVFRALYGEGSLPNVAPAKAQYNMKDLVRWADLWGVPAPHYPAGHPYRSVEALRCVLARPDQAAAISHRVYRAYWVEQQDIGDPGVLGSLLEELGLDAGSLLAETATPPLRQALFDATTEAVERGVFGVPAFFIDRDFMVWGQDRLEFVEKAVAGWRPGGENSSPSSERQT